MCRACAAAADAAAELLAAAADRDAAEETETGFDFLAFKARLEGGEFGGANQREQPERFQFGILPAAGAPISPRS